MSREAARTLSGPARRLTVVVGESDVVGHHPLYAEIVHRAHAAGLAGASVFRGIEGFGASSLIHTSRLLSLSEDLYRWVLIWSQPALSLPSAATRARRSDRRNDYGPSIPSAVLNHTVPSMVTSPLTDREWKRIRAGMWPDGHDLREKRRSTARWIGAVALLTTEAPALI